MCPSEHDMAEAKRAIYDKLSPRRRKFVDRVGYDNWEPFAEPKHPIEVRKDKSNRTAHQLVREYLMDKGQRMESSTVGHVVLECALNLLRGDERFRAIYDFCIWHNELMKKEGVSLDD